MSQDDDWLDGLRSSARDGANTPARLEAQMLREAVKAKDAQVTGTSAQSAVPDTDSAREEALLARAAREGLIPPRVSWLEKRDKRIRRRQSPTGWRPLLALAAALATAAIGTTWWIQIRPTAAPVYRGEEPVLLEAPDALALKERILAELRAAGVQAIGYESLGAQGVDADLPQPVTPEVRRVLDAHGIPLPTDGVLRIEIRETR